MISLTDRANRILEHLDYQLDLSKVESGKMELYIEEFDLKKSVNEIESTIKPLVEKYMNSMCEAGIFNKLSIRVDNNQDLSG